MLGLRTGAVEPGLDADLVVLDDALAVRSVMVRGAWVSAPSSL
jgi:N-acetylglucosamine-6-phosphate deacetylase